MKQVSLYWLYIKKKKNNVKDPYRELGNKKKTEKMKKITQELLAIKTSGICI